MLVLCWGRMQDRLAVRREVWAAPLCSLAIMPLMSSPGKSITSDVNSGFGCIVRERLWERKGLIPTPTPPAPAS